MGILKSLGKIGGYATGAVLGGPFIAVGTLIGNKYVADIGEDIAKATYATGELTGRAASGVADTFIGAVTLDKDQINEGLSDVGSSCVQTLNGITSGVASTIIDGKELVGGVATLDGQKVARSSGKILRKALIASIAFTVADEISGGFLDDSDSSGLIAVDNSRAIFTNGDASVHANVGLNIDTLEIDVDSDGSVDIAAASVDIDGDGLPEATAAAADINGDGFAEFAAVDVTGDGHADVLMADISGDGQFDAIAVDFGSNGVTDTSAVAIDADGDGYADTIVTTVDVDQDGVPDLAALDINGDGNPDLAGADLNGDGFLDIGVADLDGDGTADIAVADIDGDGLGDIASALA